MKRLPRCAMALVLFIVVGTTALFADESEISGIADLQQQRNTLSSLWTFATLNYLYCDVVSLMDSEMLNEYLTGEVGGFEMSDNFLMAATIMMEVPMSMVFLSQVLEPKALRIASVSAGIFMTAIQTATLITDKRTSYYLFSSIVEIATTGIITAYSWRNLSPGRVDPMAAVTGDGIALAVRIHV